MGIRVTREGPDCTESTIHAFDGVVYVATQDDEWVLTPGDTAHISVGSRYRYWDAGDDEAHWLEVHCVG